MTRHIELLQERLGKSIRCALLDDLAPRSCDFLWSLAGSGASFTVNHAMWTGPELSLPLPAATLPEEVVKTPVPQENSTSFPRVGDVVVVWLAAGAVRGLPPGDFFDIGVIYDEGARLLMPFGWIQGNVAARVIAEDLATAQEMARDVRAKGSCRVRISLPAGSSPDQATR
jgi:Protein of unknown function (DUF3830)